MMQIGIPPGHTPNTLPPIINLDSANKVTFNLFCKQISAVSIKYGRKGAIIWNFFNQPAGPEHKPWTAKMNVDVVVADLERDLKKSPYFKHRDKERNALQSTLENISGTAFSLQQLLFDLDNGFMESGPDFASVDDPDVRSLLEANFRDIYSKNAKENGLPLIAVMAVSNEPDPSSLHMTAFERTVTLNGGPATTLNYLCAVNNNPRAPPNTAFGWNWVRPEDINKESGVIAVNRNILAEYMAKELQVVASEFCVVPQIGLVHGCELVPGSPPTVTIHPSGSDVIFLEYRVGAEGLMGHAGSDVGVYVGADLWYRCFVKFEGQAITVEQRYALYLQMPDSPILPLIQRTLIDTYSISADEKGSLQLTKIKEHLYNDDRNLQIDNKSDNKLWAGLVPMLVKTQEDLRARGKADLHGLRISQLHNFIFPGGKVFKYKDPFFSDYQDLVCEITYLDSLDDN